MIGAKVDVLAVIDAACATFENIRFERRHESTDLQTEHWSRRIAELIATRAAVAELIEHEKTLCRVVSLAHVGKSRAPRWSHVSEVTSHGCGVSMSLCCHFGLDPDEIVGRTDPVTWGLVSNIGPQS